MHLFIAIIAILFFAAWLAGWQVWLIEESKEEVEERRAFEGEDDALLLQPFLFLLAIYWVVYFHLLIPMLQQAFKFNGHYVRSYLQAWEGL